MRFTRFPNEVLGGQKILARIQILKQTYGEVVAGILIQLGVLNNGS